MTRNYLHANPVMTLLPALTFGFALGVRHATDVDHVAAIGALVADGRGTRRAALVGASWGIGHSVSVLLVGGALVLFRLPMPVRVALALEFLVAIMLVALGMRSLLARAGTAIARARPLVVGIVHGLAGSAALVLLLIATTSTALSAAVYLVCFSVGTIAGMAVVTALLSLPARLGSARAASVDRAIRVAAGIASVAVGLALAHRVGIQDGLFGATPTLPE